VGLVQGAGPPAADVPGRRRDRRRAGARQGPRGDEGAVAQPIRRGARGGCGRQRAGRDRPDLLDLRGAARRDPADAGRARGARLPRGHRRGHDRRPRRLRVTGGGRLAAPARRTAPPAAGAAHG
jgi:hypothetical protein